MQQLFLKLNGNPVVWILTMTCLVLQKLYKMKRNKKHGRKDREHYYKIEGKDVEYTTLAP